MGKIVGIDRNEDEVEEEVRGRRVVSTETRHGPRRSANPGSLEWKGKRVPMFLVMDMSVVDRGAE